MVKIFVQNRRDWGYNVNNLGALRDMFREQYRQGYANRAERTYDYLADHDIDWSVLDV